MGLNNQLFGLRKNIVIPVINRAQMISDAFHLVRVGHVDVEIALDMTVYLAKEKEKLVWRSAMVNLKHIEVMLTATSSYGLYKKFLFDRVVPFYHYQMSLINHDFNNINNDDINISLFVLTIETVCRLNLKDCLDRATSLFSQFMSNPAVNTIPHRLREVIYCGAIKAGTIIEWDFAFSIYQMHTSISDDLDLLSAMACTTDPWMLTRYLHYAIDKSKISEGHAWRVFEHVARYPIGWILAWNFIRANWKLDQTPKTEYIEFESFIWGLIEGLTSNFQVKELELFLNNTAKGHDWSTLLGEINAALQKKLKWMEKNNSKIYNWLSRNIG